MATRGVICGEFWREPIAKQTGRHDVKRRFSRKEVRPFGATLRDAWGRVSHVRKSEFLTEPFPANIY